MVNQTYTTLMKLQTDNNEGKFRKYFILIRTQWIVNYSYLPLYMYLFYYSGQTESSTEFDSKGKRNLWTRTHLTREDILQTKNIKKNQF